MRAAIRGDFERLEERRGEQLLLRPQERPRIAEDDSLTAAEDTALEAVPGDDAEGMPPKRSWIDRLLGL